MRNEEATEVLGEALGKERRISSGRLIHQLIVKLQLPLDDMVEPSLTT